MHTFDKLEGIEAYEFKSRLRAAQGRRHVVSRYDGEPWRIAPADISLGIDLTPRQARVYAAEVGELAAFAVGLGQIEAPTTTTGEAEPGQGLQ